MTDQATKGPPEVDDPAPGDEDNSEQDESGSQAQDVAADALNNPSRIGDVETEHGGKPDPYAILPDDSQDLVDHMTDMERSGRIDMGAFDGEDNMDDEDGSIPE